MVLNIIKYNNKLLRKKSNPVENIDKEIKILVENMFETMYLNNGIGLAAIQVGIPKKIFIIDIQEKTNSKFVMINPQILELSKDKFFYEEGCLSIPNVFSEVERAKSLTIEFTDLDGKKRLIKATGLLAVCIQHEYDHLEGILFIDKAAKSISENFHL